VAPPRPRSKQSITPPPRIALGVAYGRENHFTDMWDQAITMRNELTLNTSLCRFRAIQEPRCVATLVDQAIHSGSKRTPPLRPVAAAADASGAARRSTPSQPPAHTPVDSNAASIQIAPGVFMPRISAGPPHGGGKNREIASALMWLREGGRGIDSALEYSNQREVSAAIRKSGVTRADIFVTSKIPCGNGTTGAASSAIRRDLHLRQMSYIDLLLVHRPCKDNDEGTKNVWRALQSAHTSGLTRAIGVSNFAKKDIDAVLSLGGVGPAINQCRMSIGMHDDEAIAYGAALNITYQAYSPLRRVPLKDERIINVASTHQVSAAQVALRWIYQQGVAIATSPNLSPAHAKDALAIANFTLTEEEMQDLSKISGLVPRVGRK
jgi:2,5-diketo-D-gluconate reductase A